MNYCQNNTTQFELQSDVFYFIGNFSFFLLFHGVISKYVFEPMKKYEVN